jgi:hypothetical protein
MRFVKIALSVILALVPILAAGCSTGVSAVSGGLVISEVVSSDSNSVVDTVLGKPDWIEIWNSSKKSINLKDYSISESNSKKYVFPDVNVEAGAYLLVYCCSAPGDAATDKLCTGFKISKNGLVLTLSSASGRIQELKVPALQTDVSYGLTPDGKEYAYFAVPTPGAANTTEYKKDIAGLESDKTVQLKINEVLPQSASTEDPYGWVEIFNAGQKAIKLSDYYISENPSDPTKAKLPDKQLEAGGYALIKFTGQEGADQVPFKISKAENTLEIANNFGALIDKLSWEAPVIPGISLGHGDSGSAVYYLSPTPGVQNGSDSIKSIKLAEGTGDVKINEILLKNTFSSIDSDGDRSPWVELYNSSQSAVSLSGCSLSDDKADPVKWHFPDVQIEANSYLVVYLSGKNRTTGNELHTNFKIGAQDKELCLSDIRKGTMQVIDIPAERQDNISYGLSKDGQWLFYPQPTPGAVNANQGFTKVNSTTASSAGLKINEVVSAHTAKSGDPDWVEIYNESSDSMNLKGYYLSDTKSNLKKWPVQDMAVKAGGYGVIEKYKTEGGTAAISISISGETLYLSNPDGQVIDEYETGVLRPGNSSGLLADGKKMIFDTPTKGDKNSSGTVQGYCSEPVFSVPGGHQKGTVTLTITTATDGAAIHYTLDGSTPTANSDQYTGPLSVKKPSGAEGVTVKAIAIKSGMLQSDEMVATYLFDAPHNLPVVCLSISPGDKSIVLNSTRDNKREREGYAEYYEGDGSLGVKFPAGLRIAGAGTITNHAPQISINLYLRGGYGQSSVTYPFFDGYNTATFKSLTLRDMGWNQDPTRLKDVFVPMAVNGLNVDNMQSKFATVYINGRYWGLYEFKENQNEKYFASKHGVDSDKVVVIRGNKYNVETVKSDPDIVALYALAKKNMNNSDTWTKYTSLVDSDYFMDYLVAETFFGCYDTYNQKFAHTTDNAMKWRPIMYDFDMCLSSSNVNFGTFFQESYVRRAATSTDKAHVTDMSLYFAFYKNDEWREKFILRYAEVLNTVFTTDRLLSLYDGMVDSIRSEIPRTVQRWNMPHSSSQWDKDQKALRNIIKARRDMAKNKLKSYFELSDSRMKELFPNG